MHLFMTGHSHYHAPFLAMSESVTALTGLYSLLVRLVRFRHADGLVRVRVSLLGSANQRQRRVGHGFALLGKKIVVSLYLYPYVRQPWLGVQ